MRVEGAGALNWRKLRFNSSSCLLCKNAPAACKTNYLAERDREAAKSREKEAARTDLYNKAAQVSRNETEEKKSNGRGALQG